LRSALALSRRDAAKAPAELEPAVPYEASGITLALYPVYLRGEAELAAKRGKEAAEAYQKIGEYRGVVANGLPAALARLGLARAYALSGDTANAKIAYQDFLAPWKDADPDVPVLKQAKSEYAALH